MTLWNIPVDIPVPSTGVWIVASTSWGSEGPSEATPYADEVSALRAANTDTYLRAWFVPFGVDLREVMNGTWKPESPNNI